MLSRFSWMDRAREQAWKSDAELRLSVAAAHALKVSWQVCRAHFVRRHRLLEGLQIIAGTDTI